ncbi:hypothetical protein NLJ89_g4176 [Agrocybe chaxingu]|uniref:Uncharacterized protein n=1 Tax=Agrocybe chaxingu TaxID=84603 RepID=A0A9W8MXX1_9AGAR|nr:hypothetical protein NLJ89_g4176 [Agrocybe chaxingu]
MTPLRGSPSALPPRMENRNARLEQPPIASVYSKSSRPRSAQRMRSPPGYELMAPLGGSVAGITGASQTLGPPSSVGGSSSRYAAIPPAMTGPQSGQISSSMIVERTSDSTNPSGSHPRGVNSTVYDYAALQASLPADDGYIAAFASTNGANEVPHDPAVNVPVAGPSNIATNAAAPNSADIDMGPTDNEIDSGPPESSSAHAYSGPTSFDGNTHQFVGASNHQSSNPSNPSRNPPSRSESTFYSPGDGNTLPRGLMPPEIRSNPPGDVENELRTLFTSRFDALQSALQHSVLSHQTQFNGIRQEMLSLRSSSHTQQAPRRRVREKEPEIHDPRDDHPIRPTFLKYIHRHFFKLLKITNTRELRLIQPLSEMEMLAYERRQPGCIQITPENWRYDLSRRRDDPFNLDAQYVFSQSFLRALQDHEYIYPNSIPETFWDRNYIYDTFHEQLKYLHAKYHELADRTGNKTHRRQKKNARAQRKQELFKLRSEVIKSSPSLRCHLRLFRQMGVHGVSSDESEVDAEGHVRYIRVEPSWRPRPIVHLQRRLDRVAQQTVRVAKEGTRRRAGAKPRIRLDRGRFNETARAPPGMPRNCYAETWKQSLRSNEKVDLDMADYDYDFENGQSEDDEGEFGSEWMGAEEREAEERSPDNRNGFPGGF